MKPLEQLLAEWEEGALTADGGAELKQWLATPEGRAELVSDCMLHEAICETLRTTRSDEAPAATAVRVAVAPAAAGRAQPGWLRGWLPRLVWRQVHLPLRWVLGAAGAVCLLGLGAWFHFETRPVARVAELRGEVLLVRGGRTLPVQAGQWLHPRESLRVPAGGVAVLAWSNEATRLQLGAGAEIQALGQMRGKKFLVSRGRVEARVAPQPRWRPLTLRSPHAEATVLGTQFALEVNPGATRLEVAEGAVALRKTLPVATAEKDTVVVEVGQYAVAAPGMELKTQVMIRGAMREVLAFPAGSGLFGTAEGVPVWTNFVADLKVLDTRSRFARASSRRYEQRLRCFVLPPATGDYTFWIHSGKRSELWLSLDEDPARGRRIASMPLPAGQTSTGTFDPVSLNWRLAASPGQPAFEYQGTTPYGVNFLRYPAQKSAPLRLAAGSRYYLEVRQELDPDDLCNFVVVGWAKPGEPAGVPRSIVENAGLAPFFDASARGGGATPGR